MISNCDGSGEQPAMSDAKKISKAMRVPCAIAAIVSAHSRKPPQPGRVGRARCTDVILVDAVRNGAAKLWRPRRENAQPSAGRLERGWDLNKFGELFRRHRGPNVFQLRGILGDHAQT